MQKPQPGKNKSGSHQNPMRLNVIWLWPILRVLLSHVWRLRRIPKKYIDIPQKAIQWLLFPMVRLFLGLGNIGPEASKPVMEGKSLLFKIFADIDGIDIELDTEDVDKFVETVKNHCAHLWRYQFGGY